MVLLEVILVLWLVLGTALHIYTLKVANENKSLDEPSVDEACKEHGIPMVVGWITSYIITLVIGIPFVAYKFFKYMINDARG